MSLEIISRDILSKAQDEKSQIELELREEISKLEKNFDVSIDNFKNNLLLKFELELETNKKTILSSSRTNAKKILLEKKSDLISKSISKTLEKLYLMDEKTKEKFLLKIIKKVNSEKIIYEKVYCNKSDLNFLKSVLSSDIKLISKENLDGLIFEINSGKSLIDLSYKQILQDIFEEKESEFRKYYSNKKMVKLLNMKSSSFECGKISAKRNKLISDEKFESLLSLSFDEIIKFLEEHGFRESVDSSFLQFEGFYLIERILNMRLSKIYAQVFASASKQNKILLETYYLKYQIHNLMVLVRCKTSGENEFEPFLIGDERKKSKFIKAFEMPNLEDSIVYISKKLRFNEHDILDAYSKGIYYLENYLYKKYYEMLNSTKFKFNGIDENKFFSFTKTYIDLLNARSLMKFKLEDEKTLEFSEIFIRGGNLNLDYFDKLKSSSVNDLLKKFESEFENIKINDENLSSIAVLDKKINILKSNSRDVLKIASFGSPFYILKYLFDLEFQTSRLRILLKSKYLGLSKEEIKTLI